MACTETDGGHIFPPRADDQRIIDAIAAQGGPFGGGIDYDFRQALGLYLGLTQDQINSNSVDDMWKLYLDNEGLVDTPEPFCFELAAPAFSPQNADQYTLNQDPGGGGPGLIYQYDMRWKPDGTRVFVFIGGFGHPAFDDLWQWDVSPAWSLNKAAHWTNQQSVTLTGADTNNRTISWVNNGTRLVNLNVWFSSVRRLDSRPASTPYDITTLGAVDQSFTGLIGNEFGMEWSADYTKVLISRLGGTWNRYNASVPGDITTLTGPDQTWDVAATHGINSSTLALDPSGLKLYSLGSNINIVSWDLAAPFSISPAPSNYNVGPAVDVPTNMQIARGLNVNPATGELLALGDQNAFRARSWTPP